MQPILKRCCGLDIHKSIIVACLLIEGLDGKVTETKKSFSTMTEDLLKMNLWLLDNDCSHVAMESTSTYWKPVFNILEDSEAVRELGKVARTEFMLRYAQDKDLQCRIRDACNDAEAWNSFHEAIFWGNGGRLRSNDPVRQEEILLALSLLMNSIVFYNVDLYGQKLKRSKARTPVFWDHVQVLGKYSFKRSWFQ